MNITAKMIKAVLTIIKKKLYKTNTYAKINTMDIMENKINFQSQYNFLGKELTFSII